MKPTHKTFPLPRRNIQLGIALLLLALGAAAFAYVRSSPSFRVPIDAATSGGGAAASASFQAPENAAGQIAGTKDTLTKLLDQSPGLWTLTQTL